MAQKKVWDRADQMPPGREFEAYHLVDTQGQPVYYHNHPHYEFYFYIQGNSRIIVEGLDLQPVKGDTGISVHQYMIIRRIMLAQEMIGQGVKPRDACA